MKYRVKDGFLIHLYCIFSIFGFTLSNQCEMLWRNCIILVTSLFPAWFPRHLGKVTFKLNLNLPFLFG